MTFNAPAKTQEHLLESISEGVNRAKACGHDVLVSQALPFPGAPGAVALFAAGKRYGSRVLWEQPSQDFSLVGVGCTTTLGSHGPTRFEYARKQHSERLREAVIRCPDIRGTGPLFMGGFRYNTDDANDPAWSEFPDALLTMPGFLFTRSGGENWVTINVLVNGENVARDIAEGLSLKLRGLVSVAPEPQSQPRVVQADIAPSQDIWIGWVRRALDSIRRGEMDKVVLARRKTLTAKESFQVETALSRLRDLYTGCTIFAFASSDSAFIGATPERLAKVENGTLSLDCLAGSAPRGNGQEEDRVLEERLFQSPKERFEHAFVVKMVAATLKDICSDVRHDSVPEVMKLKTIQHLRTPVIGRLQTGRVILDAVERLHPTPAVGGVPTGRAVRLIRELEGDRGWYSAPVGWVDPSGEGDFVVAIRSALVRDNTATLFAGSGIVDGSDPAEEFAETEVKLKPLIAALTEVVQ